MGDMALAVELLFDGEAEVAVRKVWEVVRAVTGSGLLIEIGVRPHVSLAVYDDGARVELERAFAAFSVPSLGFALASAGSFPGDEGVAFLAPVVDEPLLELHRRWHAAEPKSDEPYRPGRWVPHATVGILLGEVQLKEALGVARPALPIRGRFESLALVAFDRGGTRPVEHLAVRPLG